MNPFEEFDEEKTLFWQVCTSLYIKCDTKKMFMMYDYILNILNLFKSHSIYKSRNS